jgi:hypothetical protein
MLRTEANRIYFEQSVGGEFLHATATLHNLVHKLGYEDIVLDFTDTVRLWPEFMVPFVTMCRLYRHENVDFHIVEPLDLQAKRHLSNTNWSHIIQPEKYESKSEYNKTTFRLGSNLLQKNIMMQ